MRYLTPVHNENPTKVGEKKNPYFISRSMLDKILKVNSSMHSVNFFRYSTFSCRKSSRIFGFNSAGCPRASSISSNICQIVWENQENTKFSQYLLVFALESAITAPTPSTLIIRIAYESPSTDCCCCK